MKTTNIRGKEYVEVVERVRIFNELYKNNSIDTELQYHEQYVRCVAIITPDVANPTRFFKAHAEEDRTQGNINKTNATENCETSAVGRALGMMGIGIIDGIASADEVNLAIHKQETVLNPSNVPTTVQTATAITKERAAEVAKTPCQKCGAPMTLSKEGKPYCSQVCWKKTPEEQAAMLTARLQKQFTQAASQPDAKPTQEILLEDIPF